MSSLSRVWLFAAVFLCTPLMAYLDHLYHPGWR